MQISRILPQRLGVGLVLLAASVVSGSASEAQPWRPAGADAPVNSETAFHQALPSVARAADGRSLVAWTTLDPTDLEAPEVWVVARAFGADGAPLGPDVQVSAGQGARPELAASPSGEFLVAWHSVESADPTDTEILSRRLDASGLPVGDEVRINEGIQGTQVVPRVGARADGSFVVVWVHADLESESYDVRARFVNASGQPVGSELQVNAQTLSEPDAPDVAVAEDGGFLVVWQSGTSQGSDTSGISIQGRLFDASGVALGGDFQVNTQTTGDQVLPEVAALEDGKYAVVWQSGDEIPERIKGQLLSAAGDFVGGELAVPAASSTQSAPAVAAAPGGFLVAWDTFIGDSSGDSVDAQGFDLEGRAVDEAFRVNTETFGSQQYPALAADAEGDFLVVWQSWASPWDGDDGGIVAREVRHVLFEDGFESGGFAAWTTAVP